MISDKFEETYASTGMMQAEELVDEAAFDLMWIPSGFIPRHPIGTTAVGAARALRPGGWVLLAALSQSGDALSTALTRLGAGQWGGCLFAPGRRSSSCGMRGSPISSPADTSRRNRSNDRRTQSMREGTADFTIVPG